MAENLVVKGAREHNLKAVDIELPRDKLIVFTGISGSGKSSLALIRSMQRGRDAMWNRCLRMRSILGQMDKPDVDFIEGLSPAISMTKRAQAGILAQRWER